MKPLPQKINDSSLIVKRLTNQIEKLMKNGKVSEASIFAMVSLSSYDFDAVGFKTSKGKLSFSMPSVILRITEKKINRE